MTLTEQWKKGELEAGYYYVKNEFGNIFAADYSEEYDHINDVVVKDFWTEVSEIIEVLAPVPSYEEWKSLNEILDSSLQTNKALAHRLNLCKDLLKECREVLKIAKYGSLNNLTNSRYGVEYLLPQIDEVLK